MGGPLCAAWGGVQFILLVSGWLIVGTGSGYWECLGVHLLYILLVYIANHGYLTLASNHLFRCIKVKVEGK